MDLDDEDELEFVEWPAAGRANSAMDDADDDDDDEEEEEEEEEDEDEDEDSLESADAEKEEWEKSATRDATAKLPDTLPELTELALRLQNSLKSAQQSARAKHKRNRVIKRKEGQTDAQWADCQRKQQQKAATEFEALLKKRGVNRAFIVNRLGLSLSVAERAELRALGLGLQEWFLASRDAVQRLHEHLYTAENSLEMRLSELISIRAVRRMRRVLTEVINGEGKYERFRVAEAPWHWRIRGENKGGPDRCLKRSMNVALGIFPNRPVLAPFPFASDEQMRAAGRDGEGRTRRARLRIYGGHFFRWRARVRRVRQCARAGAAGALRG